MQKVLLTQKAFAPEFLNRIDDGDILFNSLEKEDIRKSLDIELKALFSRVDEMGCNLKIDETAKNLSLKKDLTQTLVLEH